MLRVIASIRDMSLDVELRIKDIVERYRTLLVYEIEVWKENTWYDSVIRDTVWRSKCIKSFYISVSGFRGWTWAVELYYSDMGRSFSTVKMGWCQSGFCKNEIYWGIFYIRDTKEKLIKIVCFQRYAKRSLAVGSKTLRWELGHYWLLNSRAVHRRPETYRSSGGFFPAEVKMSFSSPDCSKITIIRMLDCVSV